jgi:hypothetical protein
VLTEQKLELADYVNIKIMKTMKKLNTLMIMALFALPAFAQTQLAADIDGEAAGDYSGVSVSVSANGSIVAIGASTNQGNGATAGHVRVYQNTEGVWIQMGTDIDGEAAGDWSGESVSISADGRIVAIGAEGNDGNGNASGHVRVYQYAEGIWTQLGADIDGKAAGDQNGSSVSISDDGSIVAIGARGNKAGLVRIYQYTEGAWIQLGSDIHGEVAGDWSGTCVSLSGDGSIVAIGAPYNDGNGAGAGHARVYQYTAGKWTQLGADMDGKAADDHTGWEVSLSADGSIVAIGSYLLEGKGTDVGYVRVYKYTANAWTQVGEDIYGEAPEDHPYMTVSLSNDGSIVAIGNEGNAGNGTNSGQVRIYQYAAGTWIQLGTDIDGEAEGDYSGSSVSLSSDGSIVAIGAFLNAGNGTAAGHVRVYSLSGLLSTKHGLSDIYFSIYPNPASSQLTISTNSSFIGATYCIFNLVGAEIKSGILLSENTLVDMDDLPAGTYIIKLLNQNTSHLKLVKL